ncbi:MAG: VCBS repeat-containing protein, partial [Actinobacteria bacterium]|nr:VCBS repeat-containing protein [Actinomycetota bacterium]
GRHGGWPLFFVNRAGIYRRRWLDFMSPPGYDPIDGDVAVDRHSCAWGEATGDGGADLYCTVGANLGTSVGPNQLLIRTADGIRDIAGPYGVRDIYGRGRSVNWLDYDGDGDLDLYVGNWERSGHPSALFKNVRGGFRRESAGLEDRLRTISSSWADWDRDGDPDLLVMQYNAPTIAYENRAGRFTRISIPRITSGNWHSATWGDFDGNGFPDVHLLNESRSLVLRNAGGRFVVEDSRVMIQGRASAWLDLENDGDLDLFVVKGADGVYATDAALNRADVLLIRRGNGFVKLRRASFRGPRTGNGDSVTVADHDRDGREDVFVTNGYYEYDQWRGKLQLFANRSVARSWVAIDLVGTRWNPWGIGARVHVDADTLHYWRELNDGVAFRSQSEVSHVHLGIGAALSASVR